MNSRPLLSVVIPTTGEREALLQRAIASAQAGMPAKSVEVIVVGNGPIRPTQAWSQDFAPDSGIRYLQVAERHANVARNAGLLASSGELVRFLDDDDYLEPDGAKRQYAVMSASGADFCTGALDFVDMHDTTFAKYAPRMGMDFIAELFWQRYSTLPAAHVFRRTFLADTKWDESRPYLQDVDWMHALVRRGEVRWAPIAETVGYWCHHGAGRISANFSKRSRHVALQMAMDILMETIGTLESTGRLGQDRQRAAAKALWDYAHQGFRYSPVFWHQIVRKARQLDPGSRPSARYFNRFPLRILDPLVAEWLLFPVRAATRGIVR